jgi:uncharacterized protein
MSDAFKEREKGLEEEYFHRKNQEAIKKLREKMRTARSEKATAPTSMKCPKCDGTLAEIQFENILIDTCDKCAGVWLDSGELEQLTKHEGGTWFARLLGRN